VRVLSADVQASLALSRAMLQAVAALSPALGAAAEDAVAAELAAARRAAAPQRVLDLLAETQAHLAALPLKAAMARDLEAALIAAAGALPDVEAPIRAYG
jgi:hypothetical protein